MKYDYQGFENGQPLTAAQLRAMEEGIIAAESAGVNLEEGKGIGAAQQVPDTSRVTNNIWSFNDDEGEPRNKNAAEDGFEGDQEYGAVGNYSVSLGGSNRAQGARSFAANNRTIANGGESAAFNYCTVAGGEGSFATGAKTYAKGTNSATFGSETVAEGSYSIAEGSHTKAAGFASHAAGSETVVEDNAIYAYAGGHNTIAKSAGVFAHGDNIIAGGDYKVAVGRYNEDNQSNIFEVGHGTQAQRKNVFEITREGEGKLNQKYIANNVQNGLDGAFHDRNNNGIQQVQNQDTDKLAEGRPKIPYGYFDFYNKNKNANILNGEDIAKWSTRQPGSNNSGFATYGAEGTYSVSLNGKSLAHGPASTAINTRTIAWGEEAFAQGYASIAFGNSSFAGGSATLAKGHAAVSLGLETVASGAQSTAIGAGTFAAGENSFAAGHNAAANNAASAAIGKEVVASEAHQVVIGQFNDTTAPRAGFESVFQVGCGSSATDRRNALNVGKNGETIIRWNNGYYSLDSILNIMNNYLNILNGTTETDYFADAKCEN